MNGIFSSTFGFWSTFWNYYYSGSVFRWSWEQAEDHEKLFIGRKDNYGGNADPREQSRCAKNSKQRHSYEINKNAAME